MTGTPRMSDVSNSAAPARREGSVRSGNANHPAKGSSIKVEPIRDRSAIARIKEQLANNPRDLCLFTFGINTAYRASEILSLTAGQVDYLEPGDRLDLKQAKNKVYRPTTLNALVIRTIRDWLAAHPDPGPDAPLFPSRKDGKALRVATLNNLVKAWCKGAGLRGNYGSHTLRKSWGYHQRVQAGTPVALLMAAYGHASERQTLDYLCIQDAEIEELYDLEL